MPIRMEKDPQRPNRNPRPNPGNNRGGGGGLIQFLPILLSLFGRNPKFLIILLIGAGIWFYMSGGCNGLISEGGDGEFDPTYYDADVSQFSFGAELSQEKFDEAEVFAPLASNYTQLPQRVSLAQYAPPALHQGAQGSCVGWASAYAARTILHSRATGQSPRQTPFSPSYLYNQIKLRGCQGAYMLDAMKAMSSTGNLPFQQFPYNERSCSDVPNQAEVNAGRNYRIRGYNRLTAGARNYGIDLEGIKQNLAQGAPVVIGMQVGGSFMQPMRGRQVWEPTRRDYSMAGFSGHAMTVIGYDERNQVFEIQNSWGPEWGRDGRAFVRYDDFKHFVKEAYGLYPMGSAEDKSQDPNALQIQLGLVDNASASLIPLAKASNDGVFRTVRPVQTGQKFKVAVTNNVECYTYVFGQETDKSSYVLFPYTEQHSPYCGIVGTRVFPEDYSMVPDDVGQQDFIAVVVSKEPLNYNQINQTISASRRHTFAEKVDAALGQVQVPNVNFTAQGDGSIAFNTQVSDRQNVVRMVIAIDK